MFAAIANSLMLKQAADLVVGHIEASPVHGVSIIAMSGEAGL